MCKHQWVKVNDVRSCVKCGKTLLPNGKILHDRHLNGSIKRHVRKHNKRKKGRGRQWTE